MYEMIIYWSKEEQCYIVDVPELDGCMADGKTRREAIENAEIIIDEWLEIAKKDGRAIPEPRGRLLYA